jgi:transcription initiation factor TFIIF subunit alpha
MQSKTPVSIADGRAFQRPVTLHRRDPNAQSAEQDQPTPDPEEVAKEELLDKEKERVEAFKAEAKRLKEENQKHIAPSLSSNPKKKQSKKRRFQQVFRPNDTPEEQKKNQLRYEEAYPWHVEDFDHKQVWMGGYEQTLSESHLLLVREGASARVIPLEKYYRFKEKRQVEQMHPDQVHKTLERNPKVPRFIVEFQEQQKKKDKQNENASHRRFAKKGGAQFAGTSTKGVNKEAEDVLFANEDVPEGAEEMDFENDDLFDDDDEDPVLEGDTEEVLKERLNKIKKEQLEANIFDMVDEEDVDKEEEVEAKRAEFTRKAKKKTKKLLLSKEQNYNYEDDSDDENPYSSEVSQYLLCYSNLLNSASRKTKSPVLKTKQRNKHHPRKKQNKDLLPRVTPLHQVERKVVLVLLERAQSNSLVMLKCQKQAATNLLERRSKS